MPPRDLALLDWDNSLRTGWVLSDWADQLAADGIFPHRVCSDLHAVFMDYSHGRISYVTLASDSLDTFASGISALSVDDLKAHARLFVQRDRIGVRAFAKPLLAALRARGIAPVVISGAPHEILEASAEAYDLHEVYGTVFAEAGGRYSGTVRVNRALAGEKRVVVDRFLSNGQRIVLGLGDTSADLPLLEVARIPVVVDTDGVASELPAAIVLSSEAGDLGDLVSRLDS